jgi:SAM-dependent methyltransferase
MESDRSVTEKWQAKLRESGYEAPTVGMRECVRIRIPSRVWRRILRHLQLGQTHGVTALEFGVGGGAQLVPLYARGWHCTGVDGSPEVIHRAEEYVRRVSARCSPQGTIRLVVADFLDYPDEGQRFDVVLQFGVLEHFLDEVERSRYLDKMFELTRPGGWVVSYVPNGLHPWRRRQREHGLGGYNIPEIDYTPASARSELLGHGGQKVAVFPHNLFGYVLIDEGSDLRKRFFRLAYLLAQTPLSRLLPDYLKERHAYWLLCFAQKPLLAGTH